MKKSVWGISAIFSIVTTVSAHQDSLGHALEIVHHLTDPATYIARTLVWLLLFTLYLFVALMYKTHLDLS